MVATTISTTVRIAANTRHEGILRRALPDGKAAGSAAIGAGTGLALSRRTRAGAV